MHRTPLRKAFPTHPAAAAANSARDATVAHLEPRRYRDGVLLAMRNEGLLALAQ
jgi:hypothetical protein